MAPRLNSARFEDTSPQIQQVLKLHGEWGGGGVCKLGVHVMWVAVKMVVPFWIPIIVRQPIFRVPQKGL